VSELSNRSRSRRRGRGRVRGGVVRDRGGGRGWGER